MNDEVFRDVFGEDDVLPGQERLPRDAPTSDNSNASDQEDSDGDGDEDDDAEGNKDDILDPSPL